MKDQLEILRMTITGCGGCLVASILTVTTIIILIKYSKWLWGAI